MKKYYVKWDGQIYLVYFKENDIELISKSEQLPKGLTGIPLEYAGYRAWAEFEDLVEGADSFASVRYHGQLWKVIAAEDTYFGYDSELFLLKTFKEDDPILMGEEMEELLEGPVKTVVEGEDDLSIILGPILVQDVEIISDDETTSLVQPHQKNLPHLGLFDNEIQDAVNTIKDVEWGSVALLFLFCFSTFFIPKEMIHIGVGRRVYLPFQAYPLMLWGAAYLFYLIYRYNRLPLSIRELDRKTLKQLKENYKPKLNPYLHMIAGLGWIMAFTIFLFILPKETKEKPNPALDASLQSIGQSLIEESRKEEVSKYSQIINQMDVSKTETEEDAANPE